MPADRAQRFLFDATDIRGECVHLQDAWSEVLAANPTVPGAHSLLGEFVAASLLLAATIKFEGRLILQVRSEGEVPLLMAEASHDKKVRAIVRVADGVERLSGDFATVFSGGTLAVTIENQQGERYQSLVALVGDSLAASLEGYFDQSEQLQTRISLAANDDVAAGMLLQQLPRQLVTDEKQREIQWEHITILGDSLSREELLTLDSQDILGRLFVEDKVRLMGRDVIEFHCSCSAARTAQSVMSLGEEQLESLFEEQPSLHVDCEFCGAVYDFTRDSLVATARGDHPSH